LPDLEFGRARAILPRMSAQPGAIFINYASQDAAAARHPPGEVKLSDEAFVEAIPEKRDSFSVVDELVECVEEKPGVGS